MKRLLIAIIALLLIGPAYADGGHGHGWGRGGGWGWGGGWIAPALIGGAIAYDLTYPYPAYVQPYPVYTQPYPVYVQPDQEYAPAIAAPAAPSWYFCAASNAYYPYVSSCPSGWELVPATPPH